MGDSGRDVLGSGGGRRPKVPAGEGGSLMCASCRLGRRAVSYGAIRARRCGDGLRIAFRPPLCLVAGSEPGLPKIVDGPDSSDACELKDVVVDADVKVDGGAGWR